MKFRAQWLRLLILTGTCLLLILYYRDSLWSASIDVGLHYSLIARIAEFGQLPAAFDPSLASMNPYPRLAHMLAVLFGRLFGSLFVGMQFVALLSAISLWGSFAFMFSSLPRRILWIVFPVLAIGFFVNRSFIHLELFGNEIIGNFFFAHFLAQTVALVLVAVTLFFEKAGKPPIISYALLAFAVPVIQQIHMMPAIEVLAMLGLLVLMNTWLEKKENRLRTFLLGLSTIIASVTLTVANPAFATMGAIADHNGSLDLAYTRSAAALAVEAMLLFALSVLLLISWIRLEQGEARTNGLILKYVGLFSIAIAGLCLAQTLLLGLGIGSEYAVKKYAFGLNTMLLIDLALLVVIACRAQLGVLQGNSPNWAATIFQYAFLGLFVFVAVFTVLPSPSEKVIAVRDVIVVERFAFDYRGMNSSKIPGKYDYAIGLFKSQPIFDFLITAGILKAPQRSNGFDIGDGRAPRDPELIGHILTRTGSQPWDIIACRQDVVGDFVILDGPCSTAKLTTIQTLCKGIIDFTDQGYISPYELTGFSAAWNMGRWSLGNVATFTCKLPTETALIPTSARVSGLGFIVNGQNTQRMRVSINGGPSKEVVFTIMGELKSIDIDIPVQDTDILEFRFVFPDAIAPRELRFNDDPRELGAAIRTIEFK